MENQKECAQIMFKLTRKDNWNNCYDRLEHFKRFPNLKKIIKDYKKWITLKKKPNYEAISLNSKFKKEIVEFVEKEMPHLSGII